MGCRLILLNIFYKLSLIKFAHAYEKVSALSRISKSLSISVLESSFLEKKHFFHTLADVYEIKFQNFNSDRFISSE